jgi:hypothetical protein
MEFEGRTTINKPVKALGFLIGYAIFSTMLSLILGFFNKIPSSWGVAEIPILVALGLLVSNIIRRLLR